MALGPPSAVSATRLERVVDAISAAIPGDADRLETEAILRITFREASTSAQPGAATLSGIASNTSPRVRLHRRSRSLPLLATDQASGNGVGSQSGSWEELLNQLSHRFRGPDSIDPPESPGCQLPHRPDQT